MLTQQSMVSEQCWTSLYYTLLIFIPLVLDFICNLNTKNIKLLQQFLLMQTIQAYNFKWENFHPRMGVQVLQSVKMLYMYIHSLDEFYFGSGCKTSRGCISNNTTCSLVWRKCFPHKVREQVDLKQVFINLHAALPFNSPKRSTWNFSL